MGQYFFSNYMKGFMSKNMKLIFFYSFQIITNENFQITYYVYEIKEFVLFFFFVIKYFNCYNNNNNLIALQQKQQQHQQKQKLNCKYFVRKNLKISFFLTGIFIKI